MKVCIQCSNCGRSYVFYWNKYEYPNPSEAIRNGWGSYSNNLYCPKCTKSWEERNGEDKPMNSKFATLDIMWGYLASQIQPVEDEYE